ncbi:hypothetical protein PR001_g15397 [Phytophthora rubi]|uniref:Reverse transcriptase domain-containing protein n=1 Tax=Phytophthora rubi TaxID=129364 RepID=A0A6A3L389_9STRA|nr:hypothetical protein PR001_g15397 [Phytophthora rubi]
MNPVLGRSSYIDDIAYGTETWDQLCLDLDRLLYRLRYWGISVSLPKSEFGKKTISYLSHEIGAEGIRAKPKIAKGVMGLPFPSTLKGVQSFLGSLNYYNKFIEDLPVVASVLYELTDEQIRAGRDLDRAKEAFEILKQKIVLTPLLRHPDKERPFVIIVHANPWAASAVLGQEYDGVIFPVRFTGRVLRDQELRYHPAEKEVVALTRVLRLFYTMLAGTKLIKVYTRHSVLKWIFTSQSLEGRCEQWATRLSPWPLEIHKIKSDEDGLAAILGAGITPRDQLDKITENLIPAMGLVVRAPPISLEMLESDYEVVEARGFFFENITVNEAEYHGLVEGSKMALARGITELVVVGDSRIAIQQAQGLIRCLKPGLQLLLTEFEGLREKFRSVQLVHVKREYSAAADYLTTKTLLAREPVSIDDPVELAQLRQLNKIPEKLIKPETSELVSPEPNSDPKTSVEVDTVPEPVSISEAAVPFTPESRIFMVTRNQTRIQDGALTSENANEANDRDDEESTSGIPEQRTGSYSPEAATPVEHITERWRRILAQQQAEPWTKRLRDFLKGDLEELSSAEAEDVAKIANQFVLDSRGAVYYLSRPTPGRPRDAAENLRLVVPAGLREDLLHMCHEDFQGGHQGITRTFERLRREYYWLGMYSVS